jgi:hypothetical protein
LLRHTRCTTPWELEKERRRFYDVTGSFNENRPMKQGLFYVPVTITNIGAQQRVKSR